MRASEFHYLLEEFYKEKEFEYKASDVQEQEYNTQFTMEMFQE